FLGRQVLQDRLLLAGRCRHLVAVGLHGLGGGRLGGERGRRLRLRGGLVVRRGRNGGQRLLLAVGDRLQGGELVEELLRVGGVDGQRAVERVTGVGGDREGADRTAQRVQVRLRGDETVLGGGRLGLCRGQGDARGVVALGRGLGLRVEDVELVLRGSDLRGDRVGRRRSRRQA